MPKYKTGDIECSTITDAPGKYRAKVTVKGNLFDGREDHAYESSEVYSEKDDAMRASITYVQRNFPPE